MQPQIVSGFDISFSKFACVNIVRNNLKIQKYMPSDIDPHTSHIQTHMIFVTYLSCDLEPEITIPIYQNIFVSDDLAPDLSSGLNHG